MIVLTGGPGSGKTSLAVHAEKQGWPVCGESGRAVLRDGFQFDPARTIDFVRLCVDRDISNLQNAATRTENLDDNSDRTVFDRGLIDNVGYLQFMGIDVPDDIDEICRSFRYSGTIVLLPPWREIYGQDDERHWSWNQAQETCKAIVSAWKYYGYELVEAPRSSVAERFRFLAKLAIN